MMKMTVKTVKMWQKVSPLYCRSDSQPGRPQGGEDRVPLCGLSRFVTLFTCFWRSAKCDPPQCFRSRCATSSTVKPDPVSWTRTPDHPEPCDADTHRVRSSLQTGNSHCWRSGSIFPVQTRHWPAHSAPSAPAGAAPKTRVPARSDPDPRISPFHPGGTRNQQRQSTHDNSQQAAHFLVPDDVTESGLMPSGAVGRLSINFKDIFYLKTTTTTTTTKSVLFLLCTIFSPFINNLGTKIFTGALV